MSVVSMVLVLFLTIFLVKRLSAFMLLSVTMGTGIVCVMVWASVRLKLVPALLWLTSASKTLLVL